MKQILLSLLLLCSLGVLAQDVVVTRQKKQTSSVDSKRKLEQDAAARKRAEAKRREQARQEQLRKEQEERDRQARADRELQEQLRREQEEKERKQQARQDSILLIIAEQERQNELNAKTFTVKGVSFAMAFVKGGTFTMGATPEQGSDAKSDEKPVHEVTLSDYYIGKTEVTQELWQVVMDETFTEDLKIPVGKNIPALCMSYKDCEKFIKKLSSLLGKTFRLPTEAEWEFAARGGIYSRGYKYSGSNILSDVASIFPLSDFIQIQDVATKHANELGIYDMSGNAREWCYDYYGVYDSRPQNNPKGPQKVKRGTGRVVRGPGFWSKSNGCRVSHRDACAPILGDKVTGLRLVLVP